MDIKSVKSLLGKTVYYDTGQINFDGCSVAAKPSARMGAPCERSERGEDFIFNACILRREKSGALYYQAELMDTKCKNSVTIVPLEKVLTKSEI